METLQSTIFIEFDVNTKKITFLRGDSIIDYDSNITSIYARVKYRNLSGNTVYLTPSELEDYEFSLYTIKPATNNVNVITGEVTDELKQNVYGGVVKFEIPRACTNRLGIVKCEIHINQGNKIIASSTFVLDIKQSLVTAFDDELLGDEDFPILKQLILEIQKANNIDDNKKSKITTYSSDKIENIKEDLTFQIKEKATKQELEVERNRIDKFTKLPEGSTAGDAELIDIRVGHDSSVYNNAGDAVRSQIKSIYEDIETSLEKKIKYDITWIPDEFVNPDGTTQAYQGWCRSDYVLIHEGVDNLLIESDYAINRYCCFYDSNNNWISNFSLKIGVTSVLIPKNATKFIVSKPIKKNITVRNQVLNQFYYSKCASLYVRGRKIEITSKNENVGFDIIIPEGTGLNFYNCIDNTYLKEDLVLDFIKPEEYNESFSWVIIIDASTMQLDSIPYYSYYQLKNNEYILFTLYIKDDIVVTSLPDSYYKQEAEKIFDQKVEVLKGNTELLKGEVEILKENAEVLKGEVGVLKGDVGVLKGDVGILKENVGTLKGNVEVLDKKIEVFKESIFNFNTEAEVGSKIRQLTRALNDWDSSMTPPTPLILGLITDIHGDEVNFKRYLQFMDKYAEIITDKLCLGDMVADRFSDDMTYWDNIEGSESIIRVIGNHDTWRDDINSPLQDKTLVYNKYLDGKINNWGVVQPDNAKELGLNYYYKDYSNSKVRVIVIDDNYYNTEQNTWFINALNGAKEKGYHVLACEHQQSTKDLVSLGSNFESLDYDYSKLVTKNGCDLRIQAVDDFIGNGGVFIAWLSGDSHYDKFGVHNGTNGKQLSLVFENAHCNSFWGDCERIEGTKSQDSFNIFSVDTSSNLIRIVRVGNNTDRYLRNKNHICYNYKTHKIISQS